jgi:hypothetical protein
MEAANICDEIGKALREVLERGKQKKGGYIFA